MPATNPVAALVINTSKLPITLHDGHNDSVTVVPNHNNPSRIEYRFLTWAPQPAGLKILHYILADGQVTSQLPTSENPES